MNHSIQSFTPVAHPLNYDSLASREGCEADTGHDWFDVKAFTTVCVQPHSSADYFFNQDEKISYFIGPHLTGVVDRPFRYGWSLWQATAALRVGQSGHINLPSNSVGVADELFAGTRNAIKVAGGFNNAALFHVAIQTVENTIQLRYYTDYQGGIANRSFTGKSPIFFNAGILSPKPDLALYYLHEETPTVLYARFASEGFATERIVMPDLRVRLVRLVSTQAAGFSAHLHAIDSAGRDVTLKTAAYSQAIDDKASITCGFKDGLMASIISQASNPPSEKATITCAFKSGIIIDATAEAETPPNEKATITMSFQSGEIEVI